MEADGDLETVHSEQRRELTEEETLVSDLLITYELLDEVMNASVPQDGSGEVTADSSSNYFFVSGAVSEATAVQQLSEEISKNEQQLLDHEAAEAEVEKIQIDFNRRIPIMPALGNYSNAPEEERQITGDDIHKPFVEGTNFSRAVGFNDDDFFMVFVKGLVSEEAVGEEKTKILLAGIGVAICDMDHRLVLEASKEIFGGELNGEILEVKALIESLNVVTVFGLKRIMIFCGSNFVH